MVALLFFPLISLLVYLISRGDGMAERSIERAHRQEAELQSYVRETAAAAPADQIAQAKALLDQGSIDDAEFQALKQKALS